MVPRAAINAVTDGRMERAEPLPDVLALTSSPDAGSDGEPFVGYTSVSWPLAGTHPADGVSYAAGLGLVNKPSRRLGREASARWAIDRSVADLERELDACRGQRLMLEREVRFLREALRESD